MAAPLASQSRRRMAVPSSSLSPALALLLCMSALCFFLLPSVAAQAAPGNLTLSFTLQSARAPWAARFAGTVEQLPMAITANGVTYPANSFVLHGGQADFYGFTQFNDVWLSSDKGVSWVRIGGGPLPGGYAPSAFPGFTKDSVGRLYKVAGRTALGVGNNDVWLSTNGGVSWTLRVAPQTWQRFSPRFFPELMTNSVNELQIVAGLTGDRDTGPGLNDIWKSADQGATWWQESSLPFSAPPGRSSASFLQFAAPALAGKSVLWYFGGFSRQQGGAGAYHNDIWISTDYGSTWLEITANAPWARRGNFNAEMTDGGAIVMSSGYNNMGPGGTDNDLNVRPTPTHHGCTLQCVLSARRLC